MTLSASTQVAFTEDRAARFEAYGWETIKIENGNDLKAIEEAVGAAQKEKERPTLILIRTHIGFGSPKQDSFEAHGSPLGKEDTKKTKEKLNWPQEPPFYIPEAAKEHFLESLQRGKKDEEEWNKKWAAYEKAFPDLAKELKLIMEEKLPGGWNKDIKPFPADPKGMATRVASGKVLEYDRPLFAHFNRGLRRSNPSTHTVINKGGTFESPLTEFGDRQGAIEGGWSFAGRNIQFGVREHAMGSIINGLGAYGGFIPYCATFLTFSDYMRPAIRLAALMELQALFIFTHDSIGLGEDGPTHQPIEQVASLRAIPHLLSYAREMLTKLQQLGKPPFNLVIVLWRSFCPVRMSPTLDRTKYASAEGLKKGAYVLADPQGEKPQIILIATGSEVNLIVGAQQKLAEKNIAARIVSMPSWELFEMQTQEYKDSVFPPAIKLRLAVEAGVSQGWEKYTGDSGLIIAIDRFGASAPGDIVMKEYGFSVDNVVNKAVELVKLP